MLTRRDSRAYWKVSLVALAALAGVATVRGFTPAADVPAPAAASPMRAAPADPPRRSVAVTFDDLPAISRRGRDVAIHAAITDGLLRHIAAHRVPAIGFVNEEKLLTDGRVDSARVALLRRWVDAGLELGNHGYSHLDFHRTPLAAYQADVGRGDEVTRRLLTVAGRQPRWFRHPFLHTGRTLDDRAAFERFLAERGYRVAPVTIDNYDYVFAAAYDHAPNAAERTRVADEYLRYMEAVTAFYEQQSVAIVGREIPQVLLLHANTINADHFGRLAEMYERRGYAFIPLEQALADSAYRSEDTYTGPAGITWLHRWALSRGMPGSTFAGEPEVPGWIEQMSRR